MLAVEEKILSITNSEAITQEEIIQNLWSNYGTIKRYHLKGGKLPAIIVKNIAVNPMTAHPKGWNTNLSHQRKLKSYQVERYWYEYYNDKMANGCKIPKCYHTDQTDQGMVLIIEDLNASGYSERKTPADVNLNDAFNCLSWLATFHGKFMNHAGKGLWSKGSYWHLETRPDEWNKMSNQPLKHAAETIDRKLDDCHYKTIIHGDAKLANFCFGESDKVAAVDFQYVGKGCGMKDVAYCISSCFDSAACEKYEKQLLDHYFDQLKKQVDSSINFNELNKEWASLYKYAWADLFRFLDGWSPGHWKMHQYSEKLTMNVLAELKGSYDTE